MAPASGLSLSCRFEYMGKVHFPWSFPFLIWLSMQSDLPSWCPHESCRFEELCSISNAPLLLLKWHLPTHFWNSFPRVLDCRGDLGLIPLEFSRGLISPVGSVWLESHLLQRSAQCDTRGALLRAAWPEPREVWECKIYLRKGTIQPSSLPQETMLWMHVRNQIALGSWVKITL